jgi:hypothetical protein
MQARCFQKKDSDHPVCGVHEVSLIQNRIPIDSNAPELGRITCYICTVSHAVVNERNRSHAVVHEGERSYARISL